MIPLSHLVPGNGNHLGREPFFYKGQNYKGFTKKEENGKKEQKKKNQNIIVGSTLGPSAMVDGESATGDGKQRWLRRRPLQQVPGPRPSVFPQFSWLPYSTDLFDLDWSVEYAVGTLLKGGVKCLEPPCGQEKTSGDNVFAKCTWSGHNYES